MAKAAADFLAYPTRSFGKETRIAQYGALIGAAGVPTAVVQLEPGFGISRSATGTYDITFPPAAAGSVMSILLVSPALTVVSAVVTAQSSSAGTATFKTLNAAGAATDPANGDLIGVLMYLYAKGPVS